MARSPASVGDGSGAGIAEFVQQLFRRDQIGGAETFGKSAVDRLEAGDGFGRAALLAQQPREAGRSAQFPRQRSMLTRPNERLPEEILYRSPGSGSALQQEELAF